MLLSQSVSGFLQLALSPQRLVPGRLRRPLSLSATLASRWTRLFMPALVCDTELALSLQACWTDSRCVPPSFSQGAL